MEKLPIGIQAFAKIREEGYAYVDKTRFVATLVKEGSYYFLSRPRRFGKSLFLDTLDCAFSGRRELFKGLFLDGPESGWDWTRKHPILRIDWSAAPPHSPEDLIRHLESLLRRWAGRWSFSPRPEDALADRFTALVRHIHESTGEQAVVLVDEYDKPILDNLEDPGLAIRLRDMLKDFYGSLKSLDPHLRFVFLTGVSRFAKTGIFSGLNNLRDITLDAGRSAICGYTQEDLETAFPQRLAGLDIQAVKTWYNGYSWTGEPVYNPFDVLLLLAERIFKNWWFETVTVGVNIQYRLGFPNLEVWSAFSRLMLATYDREEEISAKQMRLDDALTRGDAEALRAVFHSFFASIPHDWFRNNRLSSFEGYWASVVYAYFASVGYEVIPEDTTNKGRVDLTVKTTTGIWIFELKVKTVDRSGDKSPLARLRERGYAEKYRADGRPVRQVGIVFDPESRNVEGWEVG